MSEKEKSYNQLQQELDEIVDKFERSSHQDVDEMLQDNERAESLITALQKRLDDAQLRLNKTKQNK